MTAINEDEFWAEIDGHLDLPSTARGGGPLVAEFLEAGFTEDEARRGAVMMESGRYFGFADVATSLRPRGVAGSAGLSPVMESAVHRIQRRLSEQQAAIERIAKDARLQESADGRWKRDGKAMTEAEIRDLLDKHGQRLLEAPAGASRMLRQLAEAAGPGAVRLVESFLAKAVSA